VAKKIKFPLILNNDFQARTLEEVHDNFDLEKMIGYFNNGKLLIWLEDRYYEKEADAVRLLDKESPLFVQKLCNIFDIPYTDALTEDLEEVAERQRAVEILKQYTSDPQILNQIDDIAFCQEDLADLLDEGKTTIYLCENEYSIPLSKTGIEYIGIGKPVIYNFRRILSCDIQGLDIRLENCYYKNENNEIVSGDEEFRMKTRSPMTREEWIEYYMPIFQNIDTIWLRSESAQIDDWFQITKHGIYFIETASSNGNSTKKADMFQLKKADIFGENITIIDEFDFRECNFSTLGFIKVTSNYILLQQMFGRFYAIDLRSKTKYKFDNKLEKRGGYAYTVYCNDNLIIYGYDVGYNPGWWDNWQLFVFDYSTKMNRKIESEILAIKKIDGPREYYLNGAFYFKDNKIYYVAVRSINSNEYIPKYALNFRYLDVNTLQIFDIKQILAYSATSSFNSGEVYFYEMNGYLMHYYRESGGEEYITTVDKL